LELVSKFRFNHIQKSTRLNRELGENLHKSLGSLRYFSLNLYSMVKILENFSLKEKTTFAVESKARFFAEVRNESDMLSVLDSQAFQQSARYILGGGSNTLFADDFDGIIINPVNRGIKIIESNKKFILLEVEAGISWHNFVEIAIKNKFYGLENLALIPGNVGGAVAQNIGAYGSELKNFVFEVRGVDVSSMEFKNLSAEECSFGYRNSIFKNELKNKFIITSAKFKLYRKPNVNLSYPELKKEVKKFPFIQPDPKYVFETVCRLRKSKLPDITQFPNAGSFFKNPVVTNDILERVKNKYPDVPFFPVENDFFKIPAGWLIEKAGWKGKRIGNVGTYEKHSLVIVNFGVKSGREIVDFARSIRNDVFEKFGIWLENEVEIVFNSDEKF